MSQNTSCAISKARGVKILPIIALVVGYALFGHSASISAQSTNSDKQIRARIEQSFTNDSAMYQVLKREYPQEYETLITRQIADVRNGADPAKAMQEGAAFTSNLRQQNAQNFKMSSIESHKGYIASIFPLYDYLQSQYGYQACNAMVVGGSQALLRVIGTPIMSDKTLIRLFDSTAGLFFNAASEGRKLKKQYTNPSDEDWKGAAELLKSFGMTEDDLALIVNAKTSEANPKLCDVTKSFMKGISQMSGESSERIIPFIASVLAAG